MRWIRSRKIQRPLLCFLSILNQIGMKAYTLSGDNYPHRISQRYNDAERLHVFRESAIRGMVKMTEHFTKERFRHHP